MRPTHALLILLPAITDLGAADSAPVPADQPLLKPVALALVRSARYGRTPEMRDAAWSLTATWRLMAKDGLYGWNHLRIDEARTDAGEALTMSPRQPAWSYGDRFGRELGEINVDVAFERPLRDFKAITVRGSLQVAVTASIRQCEVAPVSSVLGKWLQLAEVPDAELRISPPPEEDRKMLGDADIKMFALTPVAQEQIVAFEILDARSRSADTLPPNVGQAAGSIDGHAIVGHRVPDSGKLTIRYSVPAKQVRVAIDCELPLDHPEPIDPATIYHDTGWPVVPADAVLGAPAPAGTAAPAKSDF